MRTGKVLKNNKYPLSIEQAGRWLRVSSNATRIIELVESEKYEECLGVTCKASKKEVYTAYLKLIMDFKDDIEAQNALNRAFGSLSEESCADKGKRLFRIERCEEALPLLQQAAQTSKNPDDYNWFKCCQNKIQNESLESKEKSRTNDKYVESCKLCPFVHKDVLVFGTPIGRPGSTIILVAGCKEGDGRCQIQGTCLIGKAVIVGNNQRPQRLVPATMPRERTPSEQLVKALDRNPMTIDQIKKEVSIFQDTTYLQIINNILSSPEIESVDFNGQDLYFLKGQEQLASEKVGASSRTDYQDSNQRSNPAELPGANETLDEENAYGQNQIATPFATEEEMIAKALEKEPMSLKRIKEEIERAHSNSIAYRTILAAIKRSKRIGRTYDQGKEIYFLKPPKENLTEKGKTIGNMGDLAKLTENQTETNETAEKSKPDEQEEETESQDETVTKLAYEITGFLDENPSTLTEIMRHLKWTPFRDSGQYLILRIIDDSDKIRRFDTNDQIPYLFYLDGQENLAISAAEKLFGRQQESLSSSDNKIDLVTKNDLDELLSQSTILKSDHVREPSEAKSLEINKVSVEQNPETGELGESASHEKGGYSAEGTAYPQPDSQAGNISLSTNSTEKSGLRDKLKTIAQKLFK